MVCYNAEQARKDAHDRAAIVAGLRQAMRAGDKSLVGNQGYRRYLQNAGHHLEIDEAKLQQEARDDGLWVLRTNTDLATAAVALRYKELWRVERLFRDTKSLVRTRPIITPMNLQQVVGRARRPPRLRNGFADFAKWIARSSTSSA